MKHKLITYIVFIFYVLLLGPRSAISADTLSKQLDMRVRTVYVDPLYGGKENGPLFSNKNGKTITLEIAKKIQGLLESAGFSVSLSRNGDEFMAPDNRLFRGKSRQAAIHLSIKVSQAKKECMRIFVASPPVEKTPSVYETHKLDELNGQIDEILKNMKAESIREESLSLAGTISRKFKKVSAWTCIELLKGKDYVLKNAQLPTVMVDFRISSKTNQQSMIGDDSLDEIARSLADSIKEYSDERRQKKRM